MAFGMPGCESRQGLGSCLPLPALVTLSCQGRPALVVALLPHSVPSQLVPPLFCFAAGPSATMQTTRAATSLLEYNFKPSSL